MESSNVVVKPEITTMPASLYRRNVFKTLSVKPAKAGLKLVAMNTEKTNVMHAVHGLATETFEFVQAMRKFIEGEQLSKLNLHGADGVKIELGDIGYYLAVLGKVLKVKMPSDKKKIKLQGTLTIRLLDFLDVVGKIDDMLKKTYYGPATTLIEKDVRNPTTQVISKKMVPVVDKDEEAKRWADRKAHLAPLVQLAGELHAELCLAILGTTTGPVNLANIKKLEHRYGGGVFEYEAQAKRDPEAEAKAANGTAPAAPAQAAAQAPAKPKASNLKIGGAKPATPATPAAETKAA